MAISRKVLIVDDETIVRASVRAVLEEAGWEAVEGRDGDEAVAIAIQEDPDLVLLDVSMPKMDGFDALRELREDQRTAHIPVVMFTGINDFDLGNHHDGESIGQQAGVMPPDGFIEKPLNFQTFAAEVADAVKN